MTTQVKSAIAAQGSEQAIAQSDFEQQYLEEQAEEQANAVKRLIDDSISFEMLADATETILRHAFWLAKQKQKRSLREYRKLLGDQGWKGEEKRYLKIAAAFQKFSPQELAQIEPSTVYHLAENSKKYKQVIDRLLDLTAITQEAVRSLIRENRTPRELKPEKPSIWRRTKNGGRYCQIPPIHETEERTGTTLQKMMDEEGLSAQNIVAEAVALRQAYKEGRLAFVEKKAI
ncbi:hypothetical protein SAMD00079811_69940 [Scytonema sp. HK-05]|uniref:hypothetical protein n=1 Tax=Scytonema sp. HK-05 TaxID=1137095 RepID=UPI0009374364|nr:hypothetical protein [Scytonema sp. HK-05]OKH56178.1 hypothetical protein NIES2130_25490 [Scytonema sp. HK-05]BAY49365.1 hypothetical protein SAMD00079811_69940 [Scytonema sp. HK-05]